MNIFLMQREVIAQPYRKNGMTADKWKRWEMVGKWQIFLGFF